MTSEGGASNGKRGRSAITGRLVKQAAGEAAPEDDDQ